MSMDKSKIVRSAEISYCGKYRYILSRSWGEGDWLTWVMLNPSTADASIDDATIRRCIGFTDLWGYNRFQVINLFALRSTDPAGLVGAGDPYGPDYRLFWDLALARTNHVVAAWGCQSSLNQVRGMRARVTVVCSELSPFRYTTGKKLSCLGVNKFGTPYHPSRRPYADPVQFNPFA
jgi:hypothetical protein